MTIREFMKQHLNTACVHINGLIVGLDLSEEPFYFCRDEGPYYFGFCYEMIQNILSEEMDDFHKTDLRINIEI